MALNNDTNFPPSGLAPYRIDRAWCLGDSLPYLNANFTNFDNRLLDLLTTLASVSGNLLSTITSISSNMATQPFTNTFRIRPVASSNTATVIKSSPGVIGNIIITAGPNSGPINEYQYIKIYDKSTTPIPGTDIPKLVYYYDTYYKTFNNVGNAVPDGGLSFQNGIGIAFFGTAGFSDAATTVISTGDTMIVNVIYR